MMTFTSSHADATPTPSGWFRPVGTSGGVCHLQDGVCPAHLYKDVSGNYTEKMSLAKVFGKFLIKVK